MTTNTTVREADPREERDRIASLLSRELVDWTDSLYDWLYIDNPSGMAVCWVLEDDTGSVAGAAAAFPRDLVAGERVLKAWVLGDFCVRREFRTLGPALKLQRPANEAVDAGRADLWIDFPSRSMLAVHRRLHTDQAGELIRMVYLLRADRVVHERISVNTVATPIAGVTNTLLSVRALWAGRGSGDRAVFGPPALAASAAYDGLGHVAGTSTRRSVEYLSWKYAAYPRGELGLARASGDEGETASAVCRYAGDDICILDLFGSQDESAFSQLVRSVIGQAHELGAQTVSVSISAEHPLRRVLHRIGFSARDSVPFVIYAREDVRRGLGPWHLMGGDRDQF